MHTPQNPRILYERNNFLIIDKPSGLLVHPTPSSHEPTLVDWLLENYPHIKEVGEDTTRPGIVHRLDKDTSGVMVIAKTRKAFTYLKSAFQGRTVHKKYLALVYGAVRQEKGVIDTALIKEEGKTKVLRSDTEVKRKTAVTEYKVKERFALASSDGEAEYTLLEVFPKSGRTHQIRVHLASIGHPVVGDEKYKFKRQAHLPGVTRQMLHAASLSFEYPSGMLYEFEAPLPDDFQKALAYLRNQANPATIA